MKKCKFNVGDEVVLNQDYMTFKAGTRTKVYKVGDELVYWETENGQRSNCFAYCLDLYDSPEIHITVEGNKTIAVYKNGTEGKKAVAKCSPEDTFDFGIGAKLALERLGVLPTEKVKEAEPPKLKLVNKYGDYGVCGTPTKLKDIRGEALFVGDVVELINDVRHKSLGYHAVVENDTKQFIMGICVDCTKDGRINEHWRVIKNKSYSELKPGDKVRSIEYV